MLYFCLIGIKSQCSCTLIICCLPEHEYESHNAQDDMDIYQGLMASWKSHKSKSGLGQANLSQEMEFFLQEQIKLINPV